jgi:hypothetical protein
VLNATFINITRLAAASDKVYQLLVHGRWFSPRTPVSSTTKTGRHNIAEILMKVAFNTINQSIKSITFCIKNSLLPCKYNHLTKLKYVDYSYSHLTLKTCSTFQQNAKQYFKRIHACLKIWWLHIFKCRGK